MMDKRTEDIEKLVEQIVLATCNSFEIGKR